MSFLIFLSCHRNLQEDLTDDMVGLAQQLKERSLMISQSLQKTEKVRIHILCQSLASRRIFIVEIHEMHCFITCLRRILEELILLVL
jgi:hypothetical protein